MWYWPGGQRALLQEDSTVTLTLDSWAERTVTSGGLTERRWYTIAGTVAAVQQRTPTGGVSWNIVLGDIRGSTAVTIARGTSTIISQWWTPYGERRGTRNDPIGTRGYLNQPEDSASGLTYLNARYLDPRLGIFLSVDPLVDVTTDPYLYASGNPTTLADPTGLMALPGGEWLCEGGGVHGCRNSTRQNQNYNQKNNQWNDLHQRQRTTGNVGSGCHLGTTNHGHCTTTSGLRPISTLTDLLFDPDACRNASWNCAIEILGIIPYGKIAKLGKFATLAKTTDRLSDTADTAHDIHKATNKVSPYDVGTYDDLVAGSARGDGLDIHHVMQDHPAQQLIPGATRGSGPAIALPQAEHRLIPNLKGGVGLTPRQVLARDAWNLRNYTNAPNSAIQDLIALNKSTYPGALAK
jgi:RHS repeat-associated protein